MAHLEFSLKRLRLKVMLCYDAITDMINLIIKEEEISDGWDHSTIINCFKGKGDATRCGNYRVLKLLEHTMKVLEDIAEVIIRQQVDIDSM